MKMRFVRFQLTVMVSGVCPGAGTRAPV